MLLRPLQLIAGVIALSTAVIWIKASTTHPVALSAIRLSLAALLLTPLELRMRRRHAITLAVDHPDLSRRTWIAGAVLAAHFIAWAIGARLTATAQASLIVNLAPVALPFFLVFLAHERINRREILGTAIVIIGLLVLTLRDALTATGNALGNVVCIIAMLFFAVYLALGRRNRDIPSIWLYVVPVYRHAAVFALLAATPWILDGVAWTSPREWFLLLGLTCLPTMIGHSLINRAMRHFRGQVVSLTNCGQFISAGTLAYLLWGERPDAVFFLAAAIVVTGIVLVVRAKDAA
ncbi:DMT family transporter [Actomonas aquatica]|uniref:DMT family transporter n=1 Tax=Actomonas aquatica TaxID=2866162 RepID=A0ABZ1C5Q5_9BACT|nr:DMT family transporter [Opitutus sp. WL0086]WRQ86690.1 DMT family transporter [Opitutus sp. WL0086]